MGQNSSAPSGTQMLRRRSLRNTWRPRRSHTQQNSLSAAVNFIDVDPKHIELLNVNTASEEELMTLPGINRNIAKNIVEYRQAIGRFKKVEDLALVSGLGAEKLDLIRPEICVKSKTASCASSRAQSVDSIPTSEASQYGAGCNRLIDVNAATVFDLMTVNGLNQELAANIVEHRMRRGPFQTLDELTKVKGVNNLRLGAIRSQLTISTSYDVPFRNGYLRSGGPKKSTLATDGNSKLLSTSQKYSNTSSGSPTVEDVFDLLSASTQRPVVEDFQYERNGKPALRIASWNLHNLTSDKINNPGVMEVFCRTILENRFTVIAVQEVVDSLSLKLICDELNFPTLRKVAEWKDNSRNWRFSLLEKCSLNSKSSHILGFLYDARNSLKMSNLKEIKVAENNSDVVTQVEILQASLKVNELTMSLVNLHVQSGDSASVTHIEKTVEQNFSENEILIILGDFSGLKRNKELDQILRSLYKSVVPTSVSTSVNQYGVKYADNIFLNLPALSQFTGTWGIVCQGLTHLAIPRGWMWGGAASEHCPVWCELFTVEAVPRN